MSERAAMSERFLPRDAATLDLIAESYPQVAEYAADLAADHARNQVQAYYGYLREMLRDSHWNGAQLATLRACLAAAVPLRIAELQAMSYYERRRTIRIWAGDAVDPLASGGDGILHRLRSYPDEPGTARTFNHLACAVAALASRPGGVEVFGLIWCAEHEDGGDAE